MELFKQAFTIMVVGMALVFVFLAMVVFAVNCAAAVIHRVEGAPREEDDDRPPAGAEKARMAAVAAALELFRRRK